MAKVTQSNPKALDDLKQQLEGLGNIEVRVGWFPSAKYEDGTPVAGVAAVQEFGSTKRGIPARPFMRPTAVAKKGEWAAMVGQLSKRVLDGKMTPEELGTFLGQTAVGDIQIAISEIQTPALSLLTLLARKHRQGGEKVTGKTLGQLSKTLDKGPPDVSGVSRKPLLDTRYMFNTLTHTVVKK